MNPPHFLAESQDTHPSNVVPFRPARDNRRGSADGPFRSWGQGRPAGVNAVEKEPTERRLARRIERVLGAILYHALLEAGDLRGLTYLSVEKRVNRLVSRDRLMAIAHAAISLGVTADLTRLAAAAVVFELQAQSRWSSRMLRAFSANRRQINDDTLAIARLLAWDLEALKLRPIDTFASFL